MKRRILHLTDLHLGAHRPDVIEPLVEGINAAAADIIALTGDIADHGRHEEFQAAVKLIERWRAPVVVTPGNHDVPASNPLRRMAQGLSLYERLIAARYRDRWIEENPGEHGEPGLALTTLRSAHVMPHHWDWSVGRVEAPAVERCVEDLKQAKAGALRLVGTHHPLRRAPGRGVHRQSKGGEAALQAFGEAGVQVVLCGHDHGFVPQLITPERPGDAHSLLHIQGPTAASYRVRGAGTGFVVLDWDGVGLEVTFWLVEARGARPHTTHHYTLGRDGLEEVSAPQPA